MTGLEDFAALPPAVALANPLHFAVAKLLRDGHLPETRHHRGPCPERIGLDMVYIPAGAELEIGAQLTPLGGAVLVDAQVSAPVTGTCVRCLDELAGTQHFAFNEVYAATADFVVSESEDAAADADSNPPLITEDRIDILQALIDEAGLSLPVNPTCELISGHECSFAGEAGATPGAVPAPDGVVGEDNPNLIDPRWAGLAGLLDQPEQ